MEPRITFTIKAELRLDAPSGSHALMHLEQAIRELNDRQPVDAELISTSVARYEPKK